MKIAVVGTGYVGLVAGACLAETGNDVICADIDAGKIARLNRGEVPIYEPGLEPLIENNLTAGRLRFTTDVPAAVKASDVIFIAVGTPPDEDGSADLSHVLAVAQTIGKSMNGEKIVITKSTVPVGTAKKVRETIEAETDFPVHVCSNPEFLKEGAAVDDFMKPDRVVLGVDSEYAAEVLKALYAPFVRTGHSILIMDVPSAEITKYAANSMLATRISFMNAIARLCEKTGANIDSVRRGVGSDSRIGPSFLFPGIGYGGSCLVGRETVLVRDEGTTKLTRLDDLFRDRVPVPRSSPGDLEPEIAWADDLEVLSWGEDGGTQWRRAQFLTRRWFEGEVLEIRTKMGRRVRCTPDHPFVVTNGDLDAPAGKLAADLTAEDWLPLAFDAPAEPERREGRADWDVASSLRGLGIGDDEVIVRLGDEARTAIEPVRLRAAVAEHPQRLPDAIWDAPRQHQEALLSGLWQGDGSWSLVNGGPSVVLEWGTASAELADGVARLLGMLGIGCRLNVGRTSKSLRDTYWLTVSGADQVERLLAFVKPNDRAAVSGSIARREKRIAPTGHRTGRGAAWVRVASCERIPYAGWVYSMEVPETETFVTTAGLVVHNCFPKDVQALVRTMRSLDVDGSILQAVEEVNAGQKRMLLSRLMERLGPDLQGRRIAVWGLAFKPNTDDMREAPSIVTIGGLLEEGAKVVAHDPVAMHEARRHFDDEVEYAATNYDALQEADALVIHTEWLPYRNPDFDRMKAAMAQPIIFDGRNLYDPDEVARHGFEYHSIGRPTAYPTTPAD